MDSRGIFEMFIVFAVMIGAGVVVLDKTHSEVSRAQAFALVSAMIGLACPSPISGALDRAKKKEDDNSES